MPDSDSEDIQDIQDEEQPDIQPDHMVIDDQHQKITEQEHTITDQQQKITEQEQTITYLKQKITKQEQTIMDMDAIQKQLIQSLLIKTVGKVCPSCSQQGFRPGSAPFTPCPDPAPASFDVHKDCHICYRLLPPVPEVG